MTEQTDNEFYQHEGLISRTDDYEHDKYVVRKKKIGEQTITPEGRKRIQDWARSPTIIPKRSK